MTDDFRGIRGDYLIILQSILLPITVTITYVIAVSLNHVESAFPYISDSGTWPPESCIFGILLCFFSLSSLIVVHIRWYIIRRHQTSTRLNNVSYGLGLVAGLGILIVANFQETSVLVVHFLGAMMAFYVGNIYMWCQTLLSWRCPDVPGYTRSVFYFRVVLSVLTTISAIAMLPFASAASADYNYKNNTKTYEPGTGKWESYMGGLNYHIASSAFEWSLAGLVSLYFFSFFREFRYVHFGMPSLRHRDSANQQVRNNQKLLNYQSCDSVDVDSRQSSKSNGTVI